MSKCLCVALVGLLAAQTECRAETDPEPSQKRTVYAVKHGSASDLAGALGAFFKGEVEVQAMVPPENCLLLSGKSAAIDEATAVLSRLDRRPRSLIIEVVIAEAAKKGEDGKVEAGSGELNVGTFTGPADSVLAKVQTLRMKGQLARVKRIRLSALENQTTFTLQKQTPDVEVSVQVVSSVSPDQVVTTSICVGESRLKAAEGSCTPNKSSPLDGPVFSWQGILRVPSGHATVAEEIQTNSKSAEEKTWVIVAARVVEPEPDRQR